VRSEDKDAIAAFHWRGAPDEEAAAEQVRGIAERARTEGFVVHWGRKVLEVRPPVPLDKGLGVTALLRGAADGGAASVRNALYVGDDTTDVDAFSALQALTADGTLERALCVAVGSEETPPALLEGADLTIDGQSGVRGLLEALL
jgi:trehalose 6-phosphate phosphatase